MNGCDNGHAACPACQRILEKMIVNHVLSILTVRVNQ
jgi:hypothetical protein